MQLHCIYKPSWCVSVNKFTGNKSTFGQLWLTQNVYSVFTTLNYETYVIFWILLKKAGWQSDFLNSVVNGGRFLWQQSYFLFTFWFPFHAQLFSSIALNFRIYHQIYCWVVFSKPVVPPCRPITWTVGQNTCIYHFILIAIYDNKSKNVLQFIPISAHNKIL